ncbi:MAG TPA: hypothetical protein VFG82_00045 [Rubrobacter sp.]|nr:hypothetical protein [Rubrobacter sp.]
MSDEVISIEEVIAYSLDTFPGLIMQGKYGADERTRTAYPCSTYE